MVHIGAGRGIVIYTHFYITGKVEQMKKNPESLKGEVY